MNKQRLIEVSQKIKGVGSQLRGGRGESQFDFEGRPYDSRNQDSQMSNPMRSQDYRGDSQMNGGEDEENPDRQDFNN